MRLLFMFWVAFLLWSCAGNSTNERYASYEPLILKIIDELQENPLKDPQKALIVHKWAHEVPYMGFFLYSIDTLISKEHPSYRYLYDAFVIGGVEWKLQTRDTSMREYEKHGLISLFHCYKHISSVADSFRDSRVDSLSALFLAGKDSSFAAYIQPQKHKSTLPSQFEQFVYDVILVNEDGKDVNLYAYQGKPFLVVMASTSCSFCDSALTHLDISAKDLSMPILVALSKKSPKADRNEFRDKHSSSYFTNFDDKYQGLSRLYSEGYLPVTIVVHRKGKVLRIEGFGKNYIQRIKAFLASD